METEPGWLSPGGATREAQKQKSTRQVLTKIKKNKTTFFCNLHLKKDNWFIKANCDFSF